MRPNDDDGGRRDASGFGHHRTVGVYKERIRGKDLNSLAKRSVHCQRNNSRYTLADLRPRCLRLLWWRNLRDGSLMTNNL